MPIVFIEGPPGLRTAAKKLLVKKINSAVEEAYSIGDTRIFLREYPPENVAFDGHLRSEPPRAAETAKKGND